jgi:hypothetical protein
MRFARELVLAALLLALGGQSAAQQSRHPVTPQERQAPRTALDAFTAPTLTRFGSEAEFRRYVAAVAEVERTRDDYYYSAAATIQFARAQGPPPAPGQTPAQSDANQQPCVPTPSHPCPDQRNEAVVVTGSRIPAPNNISTSPVVAVNANELTTGTAAGADPSITNNQQRGVEEGDIVKQVGHYLLILQDGRIFVADFESGPARGLTLTDRADVYRDPHTDMWYDEMLVFGDRVLITGYSYDEGATEMAVFRLSDAGRLVREGVFRISSNDYYSDNNYATRLVDGNLITYTPLRVADVARAGYKWPVVRRWLPQDDAREIAYQARRQHDWRAPHEAEPAAGAPLLDAADIYRPVQRIEDPVVHTVSVCPLGAAGAGGELQCRTTAFVGPNAPEWYVSNDDVFLWTTTEGTGYGGLCGNGAELALGDADPALVYRVPLSGRRPDFIAARGMPPDQFAMQADADTLYALVRLRPPGCRDRYETPSQLGFYAIPLDRLGASLATAPATFFTDLPGTGTHQVASRFTDHYLVYGGSSPYRRYPDLSRYDDDYSRDYRRRVMEGLRPRPTYVVPIHRPAAVRSLTTGHTVIRAERAGDDIVLTGYHDARGLSVTLIALGGQPRIGSTALLAGRYESEGRSHAFNSRIDRDGSGLIGLPTVGWIGDSDRDYWRSRASDLSYLALDRRGRLRPIGELERRFDYVDQYDDATNQEDEDGVPGYKCEVSCIDWYGNSRPIFTRGRIFGLSGAELIEGRIEAGRIREVQRLNIALSPVPGR